MRNDIGQVKNDTNLSVLTEIELVFFKFMIPEYDKPLFKLPQFDNSLFYGGMNSDVLTQLFSLRSTCCHSFESLKSQ